MLHADMLNDEAKERNQAFIEEAEQWQLGQRVEGGRFLLGERLRRSLGERLIAWGRQLQARSVPSAQLD